jgi:uncharacterized membrane protein
VMAYPILPWLGIMLAGYVVGKWFVEPTQLTKRLTLTGIILLALFIIVRATNLYGDPIEWSVQDRGTVFTVLSFLNISKYPPSMLFIFVTLGIGFVLLAAFNKTRTFIGDVLSVYGQVPLFYFILHLMLISATAYTWTYLQFGSFINFAFLPSDQWPKEYEPNLGRAYLIWMIIVVALYFPCKWYGNLKSTNKKWWMSYL